MRNYPEHLITVDIEAMLSTAANDITLTDQHSTTLLVITRRLLEDRRQ